MSDIEATSGGLLYAADLVCCMACLAHIYSRTAQVVYAEGIYRQLLKKLHLNYEGLPRGSALSSMVQPTLVAAILWRYA